MPFDPDLGLRLRDQGMGPDARWTFAPFTIFSVACPDGKLFTTTSQLEWEAEQFAATIDFDAKLFRRLLKVCPRHVSKALRRQKGEHREGGWLLELKPPVNVTVTIRLGGVERNEDEEFIPLIATAFKEAMYQLPEHYLYEIVEIGLGDDTFQSGDGWNSQIRQIGQRLHDLGGIELMRRIGMSAGQVFEVKGRRHLRVELDAAWDGIGNWMY
jgi:hypothetical protein